MRQLVWNSLSSEERQVALERPSCVRSPDLRAGVAEIIRTVREDGDAALCMLSARIDHVGLEALEVSESELREASARLPHSVKEAIGDAAARIRQFHAACMDADIRVETAAGVVCERMTRPIRSVGLYVPAGTAALPSTALMLGVPAQLAGCENVVLCTPPRPDGRSDDAVLHAASLCGIRRIFKLGGAQAIAAMAYGTESVPRCFKLFGPGNAWVTEAKLQVSADPAGAAIDMPAGPSEVLVIADGDADPEFVAADLLAQAEHGVDSQVILLTNSAGLIQSVAHCLNLQSARLPRADIVRRALAHARLIEVESLAQAFEISNAYAPEHLILQIENPRSWLEYVASAGSVFLGRWSPESVGDYCSGTNHVLPTYGAARAWSGVSVSSFQTRITVQELSEAGLARIGPCAITLAEAEGLHAHALAVGFRLQRIVEAA